MLVKTADGTPYSNGYTFSGATMNFDTTWWESHPTDSVSLKCFYTSGTNTCSATAPVSISSCKSTSYTKKDIAPIVLN
jgi:hypothetical protein